MSPIIYIAAASIAIVAIIATVITKKKRNAQFEAKAQKILLFIESFNSELETLKRSYIKHSTSVVLSEKWKDLYLDAKEIHLTKKHSAYNTLSNFKSQYKSIEKTVATFNEQFITKTSDKYDDFFSNIDGKSLDAQQRAAVISEEERILVLAGAGSGKTLTIAAKVKYLCDIKNICPKDILLISFTRKSANEMSERIGKMGIQIKASTFHKLGLDIVKEYMGQRPDVFENLAQFVLDFFENHLVENADLVNSLMKYFAYYLEIPTDMEKCQSLGEMYELEKSADLETLKSKYEKEKFIANERKERAQNYTTLQGEIVKSLEETKIANFLFMHGVNYEYEKLYPFTTNDLNYKNYKPDFYLTDYDIYLEHFGISKDFKVPWLSPVEEKKYLDGIEWKRKFHKENGTKLIETYSYYTSDGSLLYKLEKLLKDNNVIFKEREFTDIYNTIYANKTQKYFSNFISLCSTFIMLFKSAGYKIEKIDEMKENAKQMQNVFMAERTILFLDIIKIILCKYQKFLISQNAVDFSDMINSAAEKVCEGFPVHKYKYIIVDEYQDISLSRFNLLKAIVDQTKADLFCVGDDWQSIYRFAGSDISLFTDFPKHFGWTQILRIEKTYRNSQELINEASKFVLKNPLQLQKKLRSDKTLNSPLVFWGYDREPHLAVEKIIDEIIAEFGKEKSILLLGRTNNDIKVMDRSQKILRIKDTSRAERISDEVKFMYSTSPATPITFLTAHRSKGLEADNVIILNFKNDKLGFPTQIVDDEILNYVLTQSDEYTFAEERRLFYVAITRTKNKTYVLTDNTRKSIFLKEFIESEQVSLENINKPASGKSLCPRCKTGTLVLRKTKNGYEFFGCSNYPKCEYTISKSRIL